MRAFRLPTTLLALAGMGAAIEIIKAPPGWLAGERYAFGNVSTFWLLFSFIPALPCAPAPWLVAHSLD